LKQWISSAKGGSGGFKGAGFWNRLLLVIKLSIFFGMAAALGLTASVAIAASAAGPPNLAGLSAAEALARLGEPDINHTEGRGGLWTYRLENCALLVALRDDGKGFVVTEAIASPRRYGQTAPGLLQCLSEAENSKAARARRPPPSAD
jgi:hypothetical protein